MLSRRIKDSLIARCAMGIEEYAAAKIGDVITCPNGGQLIYQDNGADVLAVAHLDYVGWTTPYFSRKGRRINAMQLDDRLGAWTILDLLPDMGLTTGSYDILLCDMEEVGDSTAQFFQSKKQYNWIFEFDRTGMDFVSYQYHRTDLPSFFASCTGLKDRYGSFSDISMLGHLQAAAINIGVGYHAAHSTSCYADLEDTIRMAGKFVDFYEVAHDIAFPYDGVAERPSYYSWQDRPSSSYIYDDGYDDAWRNMNGRRVGSLGYSSQKNQRLIANGSVSGKNPYTSISIPVDLTDDEAKEIRDCDHTYVDMDGICDDCGLDVELDGLDPKTLGLITDDDGGPIVDFDAQTPDGVHDEYDAQGNYIGSTRERVRTYIARQRTRSSHGYVTDDDDRYDYDPKIGCYVPSSFQDSFDDQYEADDEDDDEVYTSSHVPCCICETLTTCRWYGDNHDNAICPGCADQFSILC